MGEHLRKSMHRAEKNPKVSVQQLILSLGKRILKGSFSLKDSSLRVFWMGSTQIGMQGNCEFAAPKQDSSRSTSLQMRKFSLL